MLSGGCVHAAQILRARLIDLGAALGSLIADTVARLRVCQAAGLPVTDDLLSDAVECLERVTDAALLRARRDELIRRAALLLPVAGPYQQAATLAGEAKAMARTWHLLRSTPPAVPLSTPRDCLHAARLLADLPESQRQFYRLLRIQHN